MEENNEANDATRIVQTDAGNKDGQNKCPKCGATDISLNVKTGKLRCNFCRSEFEAQQVQGMETDIKNLHGDVMGSGTQNINNEADSIITLKCTSCGSEVVIDTSESTQARCHWCRNTLSINHQVPNGAIPDIVLPFKLSKEEARTQIEQFVGKRKFFANPKFKQEFTTENIMGVYFPYMAIDINSHATLHGNGEHQTRSYTEKRGDNTETYYDADLYEVGREFDLVINGLTVESSADKLNKNDSSKTNNIINSIMPFDVENSVKWNSNYLKGYTSEKRDVNVEQLQPIVNAQAKDIARFAANSTITQYDRGVCWDSENLQIIGTQWKAAYLPVWLYSYQEQKDNKSVLHYVAVNARTKETMGSVPIHMPKLIGISALVELAGIIMKILTSDSNISWLFLLSGIIYYIIMKLRYRNSNARHYYEKETKKELFNIKKLDQFIKHETRLRNSRISGANNNRVNGANLGSNIANNLSKNLGDINNFINK